MKRVLMVAYFFPPLSNSGTQRPLKFSTYLPEFGWEPIVLTVDRPPDSNIDPALLNEVRPGTRFRSPMMSDVIGDRIASIGFPARAGARVSAGISWRVRRWNQVPDLYASWRPTARRLGVRIFKDVGFDAVWATGFPWTSLLIGRDVSRLTKRPLIADFRDPWIGEDLFQSTSRPGNVERQQKLERSVLDQADGIVMLEDLLSDGLLHVPNDGRTREVELIPNGYDDADVEDAVPCDPPPAGVARIVFTGAWKEGYGLDRLYTSLRTLLKTHPQLASKIQVVAAGFEPRSDVRREFAGMVVELGRIPHTAALGVMKTADVLFLPSAEGKRLTYHLPGKLYEYLAVGRPILATGAVEGAMASVLSDVGGAVMLDYRDENGLASAVMRLAERGALATPPIVMERLQQYERRRLSARLAGLLDRVDERVRRSRHG